MASLAELYTTLIEADDQLEKQAAQQAVEEVVDEYGQPSDDETVKVAAEYDAAGRIMARAYADELFKLAQEEGAEEEEEEEEEEEGKDKGKEKKKGKALPPALAAALAEKKAQIKQAMLEDPEFAQALIQQYTAE